MKKIFESFKEINEAKKGEWDHDYSGSFGGSSGSFSRYSSYSGYDIVFYLHQETQRWMYKSTEAYRTRFLGGGEVPKKYQEAFEDGNIKQMTKCAEELT